MAEGAAVTADDVLSRLSAGVAEDERIAREAGGERWAYDGDDMAGPAGGEVYLPDAPQQQLGSHSYFQAVTRGNEEGTVPGVQTEDGNHIARHHPKRESAEVALKRLILREHRPVGKRTVWLDNENRWGETEACEGCSEWQDREENHYAPWPCDYITALQAIYPEEQS